MASAGTAPVTIGDIPRYLRLNPRGSLCRPAEVDDIVSSVRPQKALQSLRDQIEAQRQARLAQPTDEPVPSDFDVEVEVDWVSYLPLVIKVPRWVGVRALAAYSSGDCFAVDAASLLSVVALAPRVGERVLDLCCAPGMKLAHIADCTCPTTLGSSAELEEDDSGRGGENVGVDVSSDRLYVTRSVMRKYDVPRVRLFLCDGRQFNLPLPFTHDHVTDKERDRHLHKIVKRLRRVADERALSASTTGQADEDNDPYATDPALHVPTLVYKSPSALLPHFSPLFEEKGAAKGTFDRVLVDTECTHDGSVAHMHGKNRQVDLAKLNTGKGGAAAVGEKRQRDDAVVESESAEDGVAEDAPFETGQALLNLQMALLSNGFDLVKLGGVVVYSTCSFTREQNEGIVEAFLAARGAEVELVEPFVEAESADAPPVIQLDAERAQNLQQVVTPGMLEKTYRIEPSKAMTSFQFIAKFRRVAAGIAK